MKKTIVIKIGGRAVENEDALRHLIQEIKEALPIYNFVFVHGGGAAVSEIQKTYGISPVFKDGLRMTSAREMDIVDMGLAGKMNKYIVRQFQVQGVQATGLSGVDASTFTGASIDSNNDNRTGVITRVDTSFLELLLNNSYLPVCCSVSMDALGNGLNINADEAGFALASALKAFALVFISDIPGILINDQVVPQYTEEEAEIAIEKGEIYGGMVPKVRSSVVALKDGVQNVVIGEYKVSGDLKELLDFSKGTRIIPQI